MCHTKEKNSPRGEKMKSTIWELLRTLDDPVKLIYFRNEKVGVRDGKDFSEGYTRVRGILIHM